jgi:hypothetical protein
MILKRRLLLAEIAAAATPIVLLVLVSGSSGPSPAAAVQVQEDAVAILPGAPKPATPEQARVRDSIRMIDIAGDLRSPLDHPVARPVVVETPAPVQGSAPTPADPLYGIRITSIVGNNEGGLALINGKIYKIGEAVVAGISIKEIDARLNTVTFALPDGTTRKLEKTSDHSKRGGSHAPLAGPGPKPGASSGSGGSLVPATPQNRPPQQ